MTQQGIYVCTPSGQLLASINSNDPDQVLGILNRGLRAWNLLNPVERGLNDPDMVASRDRWERRAPTGGMALAIYSRDLPKSGDPTERPGIKWNRDTIWFGRDETQSLVPDDLTEGQTYHLAKAAVHRIVGLHLVDNVKGQTVPFEPGEVVNSTIQATVQSIKGSRVKLKFEGITRGDSKRTGYRRSERGVETKLLGFAEFDFDQGKFLRFEMVAAGRRWGHTRFNDRRRDGPENPIGYVIQLTDPDEPPNVPAFIWDYQADWLRGTATN